MTYPPSRFTGGLRSPEANAAACAELSQLFLALRAGLAEAVSRTGGRGLAIEFEQRLEAYAGEHAWHALTGLPNLEALRARVPDIDNRMLLSVFQDYSGYARQIAGRLLGDQLLRSVLRSACLTLPPNLAELNARSTLIPYA
jgi:hypothetical protein